MFGSCFTSCLLEGACLIYVNCVCLCIVVSNIHCVLLLLCFISSFFFFRIQAMFSSSLPPVVCKRTHVVSNAHCVGFFFLALVFSLSCVTCAANFSGLSILRYHFSFS